MIIITSKPGRLGNLLIVYASILAWAIENNKSVVNPAFHAYSRYFKLPGTIQKLLSGTIYKIFYLKARAIDRFKISNPLFGTVHLNWEQRMDLDLEDALLKKSRILFLQGWQFRANSLLHKHAATLRSIFTPLPQYLQQINDFLGKSIPAGNLLVGIHIRRKDYKHFENGRFYYSLEQYKNIINKIQVLFGSEQITFMVSSDETINTGALGEGLHIIKTPGHELLDLYCLSRCAFIAGPPSTYSMWASFYGEIPLYMIEDPEAEISKNDFVIIEEF